MKTPRKKRPIVPEAVALRQIERQVSKAKPEMQPELRAALRRGLEAGGHLDAVARGLGMVVNNSRGAAPEDALLILSYCLESMADLVANVQSVTAGQRATVAHGRAEGMA
jgi:hypothetical protein